MVGLKLENDKGGAVALLQRLYSIIDQQMAEASELSTTSEVAEEKESLGGSSSDATCHIRHEGWLTLKYDMFEKFLLPSD